MENQQTASIAYGKVDGEWQLANGTRVKLDSSLLEEDVFGPRLNHSNLLQMKFSNSLKNTKECICEWFDSTLDDYVTLLTQVFRDPFDYSKSLRFVTEEILEIIRCTISLVLYKWLDNLSTSFSYMKNYIIFQRALQEDPKANIEALQHYDNEGIMGKIRKLYNDSTDRRIMLHIFIQ